MEIELNKGYNGNGSSIDEVEFTTKDGGVVMLSWAVDHDIVGVDDRGGYPIPQYCARVTVTFAQVWGPTDGPNIEDGAPVESLESLCGFLGKTQEGLANLLHEYAVDVWIAQDERRREG